MEAKEQATALDTLAWSVGSYVVDAILGGNDVATDLIEDLKGLPTEPQKKKEGVEDDT